MTFWHLEYYEGGSSTRIFARRILARRNYGDSALNSKAQNVGDRSVMPLSIPQATCHR